MSYSRVERNKTLKDKLLDSIDISKNTVLVVVPAVFSLITLILTIYNYQRGFSFVFSIIGLLWGMYVVKRVRGFDSIVYTISMLLCLGILSFDMLTNKYLFNSGSDKTKTSLSVTKKDKNTDKQSKTKETSKSKEDKFSKSYYDSLVVGDENGVGGVEYSIVESQVGVPNAVSEETLGDDVDPYVTHTIRTATWSNGVSLKFELQEDGTYLLKEKEGM